MSTIRTLLRRMSLRSRWLALAGVFYLLLVGLLVLPLSDATHEMVEDVFLEQVQGFARLMASDLAAGLKDSGGIQGFEKAQSAFLAYPGFAYALVEDSEGRVRWKVENPAIPLTGHFNTDRSLSHHRGP